MALGNFSLYHLIATWPAIGERLELELEPGGSSGGERSGGGRAGGGGVDGGWWEAEVVGHRSTMLSKYKVSAYRLRLPRPPPAPGSCTEVLGRLSRAGPAWLQRGGKGAFVAVQLEATNGNFPLPEPEAGPLRICSADGSGSVLLSTAVLGGVVAGPPKNPRKGARVCNAQVRR